VLHVAMPAAWALDSGRGGGGEELIGCGSEDAEALHELLVRFDSLVR
jgi:hypothetical protein